MQESKPKYYNKNIPMEEFKVGDMVRFKGSTDTKEMFMITDVSTSTINDSVNVSLLSISKDGSPEKVWRIPAVCLTKISPSEIRYVPSIDRDLDSLVVGDVVTLKAYPGIIMVVKETKQHNAEIDVTWYNPIKNKIEDITSINRGCFDLYEMIVASEENKTETN